MYKIMYVQAYQVSWSAQRKHDYFHLNLRLLILLHSPSLLQRKNKRKNRFRWNEKGKWKIAPNQKEKSVSMYERKWQCALYISFSNKWFFSVFSMLWTTGTSLRWQMCILKNSILPLKTKATSTTRQLKTKSNQTKRKNKHCWKKDDGLWHNSMCLCIVHSFLCAFDETVLLKSFHFS